MANDFEGAYSPRAVTFLARVTSEAYSDLVATGAVPLNETFIRRRLARRAIAYARAGVVDAAALKACILRWG